VQRVRDEHEAIRARAGALAEQRTAEEALGAARALGERLAAHVRFEERELFPTLERRLTDAELADLGAAVAAAERRGTSPG
jgi:hemerythrin-like domain-containing protein